MTFYIDNHSILHLCFICCHFYFAGMWLCPWQFISNCRSQ